MLGMLHPSIVSSAFLVVMKTRRFGPFSRFSWANAYYSGSVHSFEGIYVSHQTRRFSPFLAVFMSYWILFWGRRHFRGIFLAVIKTRRFGPFLAVFTSYCILFWGPSTVSRAFLAVINTRRFGPFSPFSNLLHTVLGSVESFEGISGSHQNSSIWSILAIFMSYCILFWGPSTVSRAFLVVIKTRRFGPFSQFSWAIAHCFGVRQ